MNTGIMLPFKVGVSPTLHIRGIIATEEISAGQLVERCPAIVYQSNEHADQTVFSKYVFEWDATHEALALGYGSLMNHAEAPNVEVDFDTKRREIIFTAKREIHAGEELTIHYNDGAEGVDEGYFSFDKEIN